MLNPGYICDVTERGEAMLSRDFSAYQSFDKLHNLTFIKRNYAEKLVHDIHKAQVREKSFFRS